MTQTYESGFTTSLAAKLNPTDVTATVVTAPTVTAGRMFLTDGQQKEWFSYTGVTGTTLTGLTRGLSQIADPATVGTGLTWIAGTVVELVAMHDQLPDKNESTTFRDTVTVDNTSVSGFQMQSLTTAERDAVASPSNGDIIYNETTGAMNQYIGGAWTTFATGAVVNASTTVAGKVELATSAETQAGTDTGGSAELIAPPSDIAANEQSATFVYAEDGEASDTYVISLTPNLTAYTTGQRIRFKATTVNTGACTLNVDSLGAKSIKTRAGDDPQDGDIAASEIVEVIYDGTNFVLNKEVQTGEDRIGVVELATDAEVSTGTDTGRVLTCKTAADNYVAQNLTVVYGLDTFVEAAGGTAAPAFAWTSAVGMSMTIATTTAYAAEFICKVPQGATGITAIKLGVQATTGANLILNELNIARQRVGTATIVDGSDTTNRTYALTSITADDIEDITLNTTGYGALTVASQDLLNIQVVVDASSAVNAKLFYIKIDYS